VSSKKSSGVSFMVSKNNKNKAVLKCYSNYVQNSSIKGILQDLITLFCISSENLREIAQFDFSETLEYRLVWGVILLFIKNCPYNNITLGGNKNRLYEFLLGLGLNEINPYST